MRPRVPLAASLLAGALASGPALLVLVIARLVLDVPGALEAVADGVLRHVPLPAFDAAIGALGPGAKGGLALGVALGAVAAGALLAPVALRAATVPWSAGAGRPVDGRSAVGAGAGRPVDGRSAVGAGAAAAGVALIVIELIVLPIAGAGLLGTDVADPLALQAPLVVAALAYGFTLVGIVEAWSRASEPRAVESPDTPAVASAAGTVEGGSVRATGAPAVPTSSRRTVLRGLLAFGGLSLAAAFGIVGWRATSAVRSSASVPAPTAPPGDPFGPTPALTPVPAFYKVSKDLGPPTVDGAAWRLSVGGLVDHALSMTLDGLRAMPSSEDDRTLMCISYDILAGDPYIGNQRWRGLPVTDLLDRAGVHPEARFVLWRAADGYTESLPIDVARDPGTWIVFEMDGKPLEADHGFPARILIPDRFGMKGPKWLTDIVLSATDEPGYWEQRGWDQEAREKIMSRIDLPRAGDAVPVGTTFPVTGVAFAGARGVSRVEVSADGGSTWKDARLEDASTPPLGPLTWVRFRAEVSVPAAGRATLVVRATDGTGGPQVEEASPPLPDGSTGWEHVEVVAG